MNDPALNNALVQYLSANPWIPFLLLWIIIWKALALWQSARRGQKIWFIALLVVNTLGLLEIIYLVILYFQSKREGPINPIAPKDFTPPQNPNLP
jgi:methionyl-tRNA synthetase